MYVESRLAKLQVQGPRQKNSTSLCLLGLSLNSTGPAAPRTFVSLDLARMNSGAIRFNGADCAFELGRQRPLFSLLSPLENNRGKSRCNTASFLEAAPRFELGWGALQAPA